MSVQDCGVALFPKIDIENQSNSTTKAYLSLVTEENYEIVKKDVTLNTGGKYGFVFSGFFNGNFSEFEEKRKSYFSQNGGSLSEASAKSIFQQSLTPEQLTAWLGCIKLQTEADGKFKPHVSIILSDDSAQFVQAKIEHIGNPGPPVKFDITIINGKANGKTAFDISLFNNGSQVFTINRNRPTDEIIVNVNSNIGLSDSAHSHWPPLSLIPFVLRNDINAVDDGLNHGADANEESSNRSSVLMLAADNGFTEIVNLLLKHRADVNFTGAFGQTPLHMAAGGGKLVIVKMIFKGGVRNINSRITGLQPRFEQYTPLSFAVDIFNQPATLPNKKVEYAEIITFLKQNGGVGELRALHPELGRDD